MGYSESLENGIDNRYEFEPFVVPMNWDQIGEIVSIYEEETTEKSNLDFLTNEEKKKIYMNLGEFFGSIDRTPFSQKLRQSILDSLKK